MTINVKELTVLGLDLMPGAAPEGEARYSIVVVRNGRIVERKADVSIKGLFSLVKKYKPDYIAVDNIYELAVNHKDLIKFAKRLPVKTKIIQVTRVNGVDYPLEVLAKKYGLVKDSCKLPPLKTAEVCAQLVLKGVGSVVELFENETKIIVSRGRSLGAGGMSQARYQRNIRGLILRVTREIKEKLEKSGIDYDVFYRKSTAGLEWSVFIVYTPREKLYGLIKPKRGHDIQVIIEPVVKSDLIFRSLEGKEVEYLKRKGNNVSSRYLIVGIDPGITTGVAIMDLSGRVLSVKSGREMSRSAVIELISQYGKPIIISTDVCRVPNFVKKIASSLNSVLFAPERNLTIEEKREIVQNYLEKQKALIRISNSHERDALAAAIRAYQHYLPKFRQVESYVKELPFKVPLSYVKAMVIKGKTIKDAVKQYIETTYSEALGLAKKKPIGAQVEDFEKILNKIMGYVTKINSLESENLRLKEEINKLRREREELIQTIEYMKTEYFEKIMRDRMYYTLQSRLRKISEQIKEKNEEIKILESEIEKWRNVALKLASKKVVAVPVIKMITLSALSELKELVEDTILVKTLSFIDERALGKLKAIGVKVILTLDEINENRKRIFAQNDLALAYIGKKEVEVLGSYALISKNVYSNVVENALKELERLRDQIVEERIEEILNEYRRERMKAWLNKA